MDTGDVFGEDYRLLGLLGRGGMGEVHRAQDLRHDRVVALKLLPEDLAADRTFQERFRREARAASRLSQPHIVSIHRHGDIDGRLFIDMALVEGHDLATLIARHGPMPADRAVDVVGQVASALDAAHAVHLVHRDVKPSNVLLAAGERGRDFAYLTDFGIARDLSEFASTAMTHTGNAVGTVAYMAPERWGSGPVDGRADVYSLACVLHECLTGRPPFPSDNMLEVIDAHRRAAPPRASHLAAGVPPGLDGVIAQGLAKDPAHRFPTAGALAAAAHSALLQDTRARSGGHTVPPGPSGSHLVPPTFPVPSGSYPVPGAYQAAHPTGPSGAYPAPPTVLTAPAPARRAWRGRVLTAVAVVVAVLATIGVLRVVDLVDGGGTASAAGSPASAGAASPTAEPVPTTAPRASSAAAPTAASGAEATGGPLSDLPGGGPAALPRWTGEFRITRDGYDLDTNPEELGNRGSDIQYDPSDRELYASPNYTEVALWTGATQPTAAECTRLIAAQPLSNNEQQVMPIDAGTALCIATGEHVSFVRVVGEPQGEGLPAEYVIWRLAQ